MRTQPEHMVVGFRLGAIVGATERAVEQLLSGGVRTRFLSVIASNRSVPFMCSRFS